MKCALVFMIVVLLVVVLQHQVEADFLYDRFQLQGKDLSKIGLKCVPGRTVIRMRESILDDPDTEDFRKSHMRITTEDESCQVCVCSVEGKDEYCTKRPAKNVNECIRMANLVKNFQNSPYEHDRDLSHRIRRDYIWHRDEIPYDGKAKCSRGTSYYSNSMNANDTDIDVPSDVESLLDYSNTDICFYCVCHVSGDSVGCISRNPWYCQYYRNMRQEEYSRDVYRNLFQQDRPVYFRTLSYRLRRTMDSGIFDLVEAGGDSLCCEHPAGHRRQLHSKVKRKLVQLRKKINKENLLSKSVNGDYVDFVVNND